jgi:hypothetical protein
MEAGIRKAFGSMADILEGIAERIACTVDSNHDMVLDKGRNMVRVGCWGHRAGVFHADDVHVVAVHADSVHAVAVVAVIAAAVHDQRGRYPLF